MSFYIVGLLGKLIQRDACETPEAPTGVPACALLMNISRMSRLQQWSKTKSVISPRMLSHANQRAPLRFKDGPLVWVDCEMTGLDPQKDKILGMYACSRGVA